MSNQTQSLTGDYTLPISAASNSQESVKAKATIHSIQYLRAVAALMVVLHHAFIQIDAYKGYFHNINFGAQGVDIFFVISGFIIWYVTDKSNVSKTDFLIRRIVRVAPIYWFVTLAIIALAAIAPELFKTTKFTLSEVWQSLLFIPHYNLAFPNNIYPILVPGWTLNYELFFYFVFALILFTRQRVLALILSFTTLMLIGFYIDSTNPLFITYTNTLLAEFVLGALIASTFLRNPDMKMQARHSYLMIILGFVLIVIFSSYVKHDDVRGLVFGIPSAMIVIGALMLERSGKMPRHRLLHLLGDASYSIYLTHIFSLGLFRTLWSSLVHINAGALEITVFMVLSLVFSSIIGIFVYQYVEKPLLVFFKKRLAKTN